MELKKIFFLLLSFGGLGWILLFIGGHYYDEWENEEILKERLKEFETIKTVGIIPQQLTVQKRVGETYKVVKKITDENSTLDVISMLHNEEDSTVPENAEPPDYKFMVSWKEQAKDWNRLSGRYDYYIKTRKEQYQVWLDKEALEIIKEGKGESKRKVVLTQDEAVLLVNFFTKEL
ncbi:hypothetical protein AB1K84_25550 [Mesobacillus foraminis]|uniref:hypothetical protein n=1 Tax=Mesobacillus foraminis TaxID=279826 RepID=UPI0039A0689E